MEENSKDKNEKKWRKIKPKLDCSENSNKIDKSLAWSIQKNEWETQITNIKNKDEGRYIIMVPTDIKRTIREY